MNLVITISGLHGTGKSTYAKELAKEFGLRYISAGIIFRQIAAERGVTLEELSRIAVKDKRIDRLIDKQTVDEARKGSAVLDGHLAGWMAREYADIKIFLTAPTNIRAQRIAKRDNLSTKEAARQLLTIERIERGRWKKFYKIDPSSNQIYDIVINTGLFSLDCTLKILKEIIRKCILSKQGA
mgnify:CR=1 FL=1